MRRPLLSGLALLVAVGCVIETVWSPRPLLVWNVTASAPIGLYRRSGASLARGDWALVRTPETARALASQRHYLPGNVPMVKKIAALAGDLVCRNGGAVSVNGVVRAVALAADHQGRPLPVWQGCRRLSTDQIFLLTAPPSSFDSRYFWAVPRANLIERIVPLWTF